MLIGWVLLVTLQLKCNVHFIQPFSDYTIVQEKLIDLTLDPLKPLRLKNGTCEKCR